QFVHPVTVARRLRHCEGVNELPRHRMFTSAAGEADTSYRRLMIDIHLGDNLEVLRAFEPASFDLIYIDPPFNTGKQQSRQRLRTVRDEAGDRIGFQGRRYRTIQLGTRSFADAFDDYLAFLEPRLIEAHRLLKPDGSFFLHLDYREVHY